MALRCNANNEHANATNPWSSGSFTIAFWMHRLNVTTARFLCGLLDTDDATPEGSGVPRVRIGTGASNVIEGRIDVSAGFFADSTGTYATNDWSHVAIVVEATGTTATSVEVYVSGNPSGSPGIGSRDLSADGAFDVLRIGSDTTSFSNCDFAHFAYYSTALSASQITELQTKLPNAITGASPVLYYPLLEDGNNDGSGGATYNLTLSGATIDSTNDGTLPALSGGGASSVTLTGIASAEAFGTAALGPTFQATLVGVASAEAFGAASFGPTFQVAAAGIASAEAFGSLTLTGAGQLMLSGITSEEAFGAATVFDPRFFVALTGIPSEEAFGNATVFDPRFSVMLTGVPSGEAFGAVAIDATHTILLSGIASAEAFGAATFSLGATGDIRLQFSIQRERGGYLASATSLKYVVFNADHTAVIASGTALSTNTTGQAELNLFGTEYSIGDYVPILVAEYNSATPAQDREVRAMFGFVPALAQL